jgi:hypothetical protein
MRNSSIQINLRPGLIIAIVIVWCYCIQRIVVPFSYSLVYLGSLLVTLAAFRAYRDCTIKFSVTRQELGCLLGILAFNIALHWKALFYSLAGDELYHVDRALPLAAIYDGMAPLFSATDMDLLRSSMWRVIDPRHLQVIDIWRICGFVALVSGIVLYGLIRWSNKLFSKRAFQIGVFLPLATIFVGGVCYGEFSQQPAEAHPPLRLLPLFLSNLAFGLNPFASRIPGVIASGVCSWLFFMSLRRSSAGLSITWCLLISLATGFIPVVYYSSEVVEPSIYGYFAYVSVMLAVAEFVKTAEPRFLIVAGLLATMGALSRQPTAVVWGLVILAFLSKRSIWSLRHSLQVFAPLLVLVPYLYSVSRIGHVAVGASDADKLTLFFHALTSGTAFMAVLNSNSVVWVCIAVAAAFWGLVRIRPALLTPLILFPVALVLYHTIWPYLWGMGRYQAEYIAPFIVYVLWLAAQSLPVRARVLAGAVLGFACITTLELNANSSSDVNFQNWPQRRLSTGANFPYKEALGLLKREETLGDFVILEGSPIYGKMVLWQSGFSLWESARWQARQGAFNAFLMERRSQEKVREFVLQNKIKALVVQSGTRRELQHRISKPQAELQASLEVLPLEARNYFYKHAVFYGEHGGVITIYKPRS